MTTIPLPETPADCVKTIGELTRAMGKEFDASGCSDHWQTLGEQLAAVKEHRLKLLKDGNG
jgi:hypothetical protein